MFKDYTEKELKFLNKTMKTLKMTEEEYKEFDKVVDIIHSKSENVAKLIAAVILVSFARNGMVELDDIKIRKED